jgi:23S rRNA (uracil1939-C5)-methyltransferase
VAIIEEGVCRIQSINSKGMGVGFSEQGKVEVPYALEGELVRFARHKYRNHTNCVLVEVLESSPKRVLPECEYFLKCGGCLLQHFSDQDYLVLKKNMVVKALEKFEIKSNILPVITVPSQNRRRANLEAVKKEEQIYMGFHKFHANQIVNIDHCPALLPNLSKLLLPLKDVLSKILQHKQKAQVFLTLASNGIDVTLEIYKQKRLEEDQKIYLQQFAQENDLIRLVFRAKKFTDIVYQTQSPYVLFDGVQVDIDAYCFLQASFASDTILQNLILKYSSCSEKAIDLFCGRGTYTLLLSRIMQVDAIESDPKALEALRLAAVRSGRIVNLARRDLFENPLYSTVVGDVL